MALWRFGKGWREETMQAYLAELKERSVNFDVPVAEMTAEHGWRVDGSEECIGTEPPGPPLPDGLFARARQGVAHYDFSEPRIVEGHFDPRVPLPGRDMLLEMKVLGFRFLGGVRVHSVRDESSEMETRFGFRYDTLDGHIERGYEWFLLTKDHRTGEVRFQIEAHWRPGDFPSWWSALGFRLSGEHFRRAWRRLAPQRLRELACKPATAPVAEPGELAHRGDETPERTSPARGGRVTN